MKKEDYTHTHSMQACSSTYIAHDMHSTCAAGSYAASILPTTLVLQYERTYDRLASTHKRQAKAPEKGPGDDASPLGEDASPLDEAA
jgi:hypothetical protein